MEIISEKQFGLDLKTCIARDYNIELLKKVIRILETQGELPKADRKSTRLNSSH